jgi:23S rRNA (adenine2503-C2)-methyltransferase
MDFAKLKQFLDEKHQAPYRFKQIAKNYFSGRFNSFESMSDLPKDLRNSLSSSLVFSSVKPVNIVDTNTTKKALLELEDGQRIESVLMDYDDWITVCVSSQVGCPLGCKFCATGQLGFKRNLTETEIYEQVLFWNRKIFPKYVGRVVFMGMGEPFLNWDNLMASLDIINAKEGLNIGARKMSISTAGVADRIKDFADLNSQINLAVSLHSASQENREKIMPIARKFSIPEILSACKYYTSKTNRQIFFEYALMNEVNDSPKDVELISNFINSNHLYYLNIIPLNPVEGGMVPSTKKNFDNFINGLNRNHVNYSIRRTFGQSFDAACGQLAAKQR